MISGTFHPMAQDWRYFSKEKSLLHTLHVGELPTAHAGETVLILPTAPAGRQHSGPGGVPMPMPTGPYFQTNAAIVTNSSLIITCYGSTNYLGQTTAARHMGVHVASQDVIEMTPEESGWFIIHAEAQGDMHTLGYQGPNSDGKIAIQLYNDGTLIASSTWELFMVGATAGHYLQRIPRTSCETLVYGGGTFRALATGLGAAPLSYLSMWAMKVADL